MLFISIKLLQLRNVSFASFVSLVFTLLSVFCLVLLPAAYASSKLDASSESVVKIKQSPLKAVQHELSSTFVKSEPIQSNDQQLPVEIDKVKNTSAQFSRTGAGPQVGIGQWFRTITSLFFVVILIFVFAWILKKIQGQTSRINNDIQVLSSFALSNKERLIKIQVDGKRLLLAASPSGIQLITHLDGKHDATVESDET